MKALTYNIIFQLSDVLKCKDAINYYVQKNVKLFEMLLNKIKALKELICVLEIAFQDKSLTLSDVFGTWTKMKLHLEACTQKIAYKTKLSQHLLSAINVREHTILKNSYMECCLFLDPRFRSFILKDHDAVERAKAKLITVWCRLNPSKSATNSAEEAGNESSDLHFSFDAKAELNKLMCQNESNRANISHEPIENANDFDIEGALDLFQPNVLSSESSVLEFWSAQKDSPLHNVAMAVFSIPPTQVQIERDFSSLGHVFGIRRYRLSQHLLEAVLLIHLNKDVFFDVKEELLQNVINNQVNLFALHE